MGRIQKQPVLRSLFPLIECLSFEAGQYYLSLSILVRPTLRLLPGLLEGSKLAHCGYLMTIPLKLVLRIPFTLEDRRVDCTEYQVILRAREVEEAETVHVALVFGRQRDLRILSVLNPRLTCTSIALFL